MRMRRRSGFALVATLATISLAGLSTPTASAHTEVPLSNNATSDQDPQISGDNVIWSHRTGNQTFAIWLWDGESVTEIAQVPASAALHRSIDGDSITFSADDGNDPEIYVWDGSSVSPATSNSDLDYAPRMSDGNLVWERWAPAEDPLPAQERDIYFSNGQSVVAVTNDPVADRNPEISGTNVVWLRSTGSPDPVLMFWDGTTTTQITPEARPYGFPAISGTHVVWYAPPDDGVPASIQLWDGTTTSVIGDASIASRPDIDGSYVVWNAQDGGGDYEIFLWDGETTTQLTHNSEDDHRPKISGTRIVWQKHDGNDWEIYTMDLAESVPGPGAPLLFVLVGSMLALGLLVIARGMRQPSRS